MAHSSPWHRGEIRCQRKGCDEYALVGVSVQLSTSGGRKARTQVRATTVRLCGECLDALADGKIPKELANSIHVAVTQIRRDT